MDNGTKKTVLPSLVESVVNDPGECVDNIFAKIWKCMHLNMLIQRAGIRKRTGVSVTETVFLLVLWKWIDVSSIRVFARRSLKTFSDAKKDVMYDLLKREDINWRGLNSGLAQELYKQRNIASSQLKVYVLDDSIKTRRGKKMEGVSCHFDHTLGHHVMGQQVLTLGLVTETLFMPIDSQIYMSQSKAHGLIREFKDSRSVVAKRYEEATAQTKPELAKSMLGRAQRQGMVADYLAADAWFGTKPMIQTAQTMDVTAVLRMKKGNMKYHVSGPGQKPADLDATALYKRAVKGQWKKVRGMSYRAVSMDMELNLSKKDEEPDYLPVRLFFVRGVNTDGKPTVGKKDWALFLTTDPDMSMTKILEIYALRWSIEVYFKEAKQHLGFLKEQTWTFASHTASIHLTAIRYLMLVYAKCESDDLRVCDVRSSLQDQMTSLDFAQRLWQLFRALIYDTLSEIKKPLENAANSIMTPIDQRIDAFFTQALQLDCFTLEMEFE